MAAAINFYDPSSAETRKINPSGIGFFGSAGFGASVAVGSYQDKTYVTDGNGTVQGSELPNIKFANAGSGFVAGASSGIGLQAIPNYQSTVQIRFTNDSAVKVQNWEARIYDRSSINNGASGVTTKAAEIIHPDTVQNNNGSGDSQWVTPVGSSVTLTLAQSPGASGLVAGDGSASTATSTEHDVYVALSASPDSIGSKTMFGLYTSLEYL